MTLNPEQNWDKSAVGQNTQVFIRLFALSRLKSKYDLFVQIAIILEVILITSHFSRFFKLQPPFRNFGG